MARSARVKADGVAYYHVVSRVANKAFLFGDAKRKGRILDFLRRLGFLAPALPRSGRTKNEDLAATVEWQRQYLRGIQTDFHLLA